jgi:hypothetical protein
MNLYTEQQMRDAIKMARNGARSEDNIIGSLNFIKPPIELPSDEEIEFAKENAWSTYEYQEGNLYSTTFNGGFQLGAKWMRDKIQGGNK